MSAGETLELDGGAAGLQALLARAVSLDATALARLQQRGQFVEVFVTTPFDVVASRRCRGTAGRDGAVVSARAFLEQLSAYNSAEPTAQSLDLGSPRDPSWPGALPPAEGFVEVDRVPVDVVRRLADKGQSLARQFSGPLGPPRSLLDQTVLTVTPGGAAAADPGTDSAADAVEIPMRMIFTCTSLGLIPGFSAPMDIPRHLRVARRGRWVRLDAPFGTVYRSTRLSLF